MLLRHGVGKTVAEIQSSGMATLAKAVVRIECEIAGRGIDRTNLGLRRLNEAFNERTGALQSNAVVASDGKRGFENG